MKLFQIKKQIQKKVLSNNKYMKGEEAEWLKFNRELERRIEEIEIKIKRIKQDDIELDEYVSLCFYIYNELSSLIGIATMYGANLEWEGDKKIEW